MKKLITLIAGVLMTFASQAAAQGPAEVIVYDLCLPQYWGADIWEWEIRCHSYLTTADRTKGALVATDVVEPAISPDGGRIAYGGAGIVVLNLSDWSSVTVSEFGGSPAWSPDGTKLAFTAGELFIVNADGSGVTQVTTELGVEQPAWSPDGLTIAFDCQMEGDGNIDICSIKADGNGFARLTSDPAWDSGAAYSPDGLTVAFATGRFGGGQKIAVMNPDGTGVGQLGDGLHGAQPAWSPDGTRIAFVVFYSPQGVACPADGSICWEALERNDLMVVNADGSNLRGLGSARNPAWAVAVRPVASFWLAGCNGETCSFNGSRSWGGSGTISYSWNFGDGTTDIGPTSTHRYAAPGTYIVTLTVEDGTGAIGTQTRRLDVIANVAPTAAFIYGCTGRQCTFNGHGSSDPDGPIATYSWSFGDGETSGDQTGPMMTHTYSASGTFTVTLTVTDAAGAMDTEQHVLVLNTPPLASFTTTCTSLTCAVNGSGSSDSDGTIVSHAWHFGDGTTGSGATASHTYASAGTYSVTLTVTDDVGASSSQSQNVTAVSPAIHVGDLDRAITSEGNTWTATVTITLHSISHAGVANATVSVSRNDGSTTSCITNANGQCAVSRSGIPKKTQSVFFAVTNVAKPDFVYTAAANHDPDGDSNGTGVTVSRP